MQRKLATGLALLHLPELVVLDEPTTGVDPLSRTELWRLITAAAARGSAVVVATTYVNEAARASSVVVLESGRAIASGSPEEILRGVPGTIGSVGGRTQPDRCSVAQGRRLARCGRRQAGFPHASHPSSPTSRTLWSWPRWPPRRR